MWNGKKRTYKASVLTSVCNFNVKKRIAIAAGTNTIENISDSTDITEKDPNFTDILGAYFSKGFNSIKIAAKSIDIFFDMSKDAVDKSNMGASGTIILSLVVGIVTVLIFIGIILSAIVKRDL